MVPVLRPGGSMCAPGAAVLGAGLLAVDLEGG